MRRRRMLKAGGTVEKIWKEPLSQETRKPGSEDGCGIR